MHAIWRPSRDLPFYPDESIEWDEYQMPRNTILNLLMKEINIKTFVDLRSPTELKDDPTLQREEVFKDFTTMVWTERGRDKPGCLRELHHGESPIKRRFHRPKGEVVAVTPDGTMFVEQKDEVEEEEGDCCPECDDGSLPANEWHQEIVKNVTLCHS